MSPALLSAIAASRQSVGLSVENCDKARVANLLARRVECLICEVTGRRIVTDLAEYASSDGKAFDGDRMRFHYETKVRFAPYTLAHFHSRNFAPMTRWCKFLTMSEICPRDKVGYEFWCATADGWVLRWRVFDETGALLYAPMRNDSTQGHSNANKDHISHQAHADYDLDAVDSVRRISMDLGEG